MNITMMNTADLIPYEKNPRKNDKAVNAVAESIKQFGFKVPITIDKNNIVVTGHTRLKAAKKLGIEKVPTLKINDLTDDQIKAFRLADNKVAELAEWDLKLLNIEISEIEIDMSDFTFDIAPSKVDSLKDDKFTGKLPKEPNSANGDIYQLGRHRLMVGDATKQKDLEELMDGLQADLLLTDPPYNIDYQGTA